MRCVTSSPAAIPSRWSWIHSELGAAGRAALRAAARADRAQSVLAPLTVAPPSPVVKARRWPLAERRGLEAQQARRAAVDATASPDRAPAAVAPEWRRGGPGPARLLQRPADGAVGRCPRHDSSSSRAGASPALIAGLRAFRIQAGAAVKRSLRQASPLGAVHSPRDGVYDTTGSRPSGRGISLRGYRSPRKVDGAGAVVAGLALPERSWRVARAAGGSR
jgi:hypothetical protein